METVDDVPAADSARTRRWVLHVDLDQFLAAVEIRRDPALAGRPVVVGGSGDPAQRRQVVESASYEARAYGVHAGMPLRAAARKCPDAVFVRSDHPAYEAASTEVMDTLRSFPVVVEVWGWDEAFVGAPPERPEVLADPVRLARALQAEVLRRTGLSCSVGVGDNKPRAKTATGFAKPAGVYQLSAETWLDVMGERPTRALWGVGTRTAQRLATLGLHTVSQLAHADPAALAEQLGPTMGPYFVRLGQGRGETTVSDVPWVARSRSRETTFPEDLTDRDTIEAQLRRLTDELVGSVVADGRIVTRVAVKVRSSTFFTQTKIRKLPQPSTQVEEVQRVAAAVLAGFALDRPVRLLGVRVELADPSGG